jgi:hypothetical protein
VIGIPRRSPKQRIVGAHLARSPSAELAQLPEDGLESLVGAPCAAAYTAAGWPAPSDARLTSRTNS